MSRLLAVDVGTTSTKAVVFDPEGARHGYCEKGYPLLTPSPGQAVQDPLVVTEAALQAIGEAVSGGPAVAGLAFSSAMHSLVGLDGRGRPVTQLLTWADDRATEQAARLRAEHPQLHPRTGTPLHPMAPLPKLAWFKENQPEVFARARRWVGIKELIVHRLTGEWVIDVSCASGTGLMALESQEWDPEALAVAGIGAEQLSRIVPAEQTLPLLADGLGLARGTSLVVGAGDGPLANLGVGAVRPGVAACSIGTSGALRLMVERAVVDQSRRLFCYALTEGRWVIGGAINNGGVVLEWAGSALAPELGPHAEGQLLELAAGVPPGSQGLLMLPYLFGERAPHWSGRAGGAYVGLRNFHGRAHLIRAAIEGVCQQLALVLASMREAGNEVREIRAAGGFARSRIWRQMLTDVLGMAVGFPAGPQGSAFGAALLGMEALGIVDSMDRASELVGLEQTLEPDPGAAAVYAALRPLFAELYDDLAPAFRALAASERAPSAPAAGH
ncbi:MAG: gluconokinase [Solirubrobacteraceae bacterium]